MPGRSAGKGRDRLIAGGGQRHRRQPGARDVSGETAAARIRAWAGEFGGGFVRRVRNPVGAIGVPERRIHVAQILRGSQRRTRGPPFRRIESAADALTRALPRAHSGCDFAAVAEYCLRVTELVIEGEVMAFVVTEGCIKCKNM